MLNRNAALTLELKGQRRERHEKGLDAATIGHALAEREKKKQVLDAQIAELEFKNSHWIRVAARE